jgi:putative transposase
LTRTEKHIITKHNQNWKNIDNLCFLSKNLYNASIYTIKQTKESTGKIIRYNDLEKLLRISNNPDYIALPSNSSQQILMVIDQSLTSFFKLLSKWKQNKKSLTGCPQFPHYKHKIKGRNIVIFTTNQAKLKNGFIHFPKKSKLIPIKTNIQGTLRQVRLIPLSGCYKIEVVYDKEIQTKIEPNENWMSIDLGINNLATTFDTVTNSSLIINGEPLKSINQYYNKKKSKIQSELKIKHNKNYSNRLNKLTIKRNNKIENYLHKTSRIIVDYCIEKNIYNLVIGYNKEWKQGVSLGRKTNQSFVNIPYMKLIGMIEYKGIEVGMNVVINEESYTSKCSALDLEELNKQENYVGRRKHRGLFVTSKGLRINADENGAMNILRKVSPNKVQDIVQTLRSRGQIDWPVKKQIAV